MIDFTDTSVKAGHIIASLNEVNSWRGSTLQTRVTTITGDFVGSDPELVVDIYSQRDSLESIFSSWISYLSSLLQDVFIQAVTNDRPLANISIGSALEEYVRQMLVAAESYNVSTVNITGPTAVGSPTSNTQWITTSKDGTGVAQDLVLPDVYLIRITADEDHGGVIYGETYSITGKPSDDALTDWPYPSGSGVQDSQTVIDPASGIGVVSDPSFDQFSVTDTPDEWDLVNGAAGAEIFEVADDARDGADGKALHLLTTAGVSTNVAVRQRVTLEPNTVYGVHFKYKPVANGGATASTIIPYVRLTNAAGTVLADDASTNNRLNGSAHSVVTPGSGWNHGYSGFFITPDVLPGSGGEVYLETGIDADAAGAEGYIDHVNLVSLSPLYTGGPYLAGFSGLTEGVQDDTWTLTVTLTTGAISDYMIRGIDRLLNLKSLGVRIPTSGTPTQADSLIA